MTTHRQMHQRIQHSRGAVASADQALNDALQSMRTQDAEYALLLRIQSDLTTHLQRQPKPTSQGERDRKYALSLTVEDLRRATESLGIRLQRAWVEYENLTTAHRAYDAALAESVEQRDRVQRALRMLVVRRWRQFKAANTPEAQVKATQAMDTLADEFEATEQTQQVKLSELTVH